MRCLGTTIYTLGKRNALLACLVIVSPKKMIQTLSCWAKITLSRWLFVRIATFVVFQSVQMLSHERCLAKLFVWKMYWRSTWDASPRNCCLHCKMTHWCLYGLSFFPRFGLWVFPGTCLNVLVIIYISEMFQNCKKCTISGVNSSLSLNVQWR